jgi:hypothetical protein
MDMPFTPMSLPESIKSHFLNLYAIALADLSLDPRELQMLFVLGESKGVSRSDLEQILLLPSSSETSIPGTVQERIALLYDFALMIWCDGKVDVSEERLLKMFCKMFGFDPENVEEIATFLLNQAHKGTSAETVLEIVASNT